MPRHTALLAGLLIAATAALLPAAASAADVYVNQGTGADAANDCSASATPCKNIAYAITQTGIGDTIFVAGGFTYTGHFDISNRSLVHQNFGAAQGPAILDTGNNANPTILVNSSGSVSRIKGFTMRSEVRSITCFSSCDIEENVFDEPDQMPALSGVVFVGGAGSKQTVRDNTFIETHPNLDNSGDQTALGTFSSADSLTITDNTFSGFRESIELSPDAEQATVLRNEIEGTHKAGNILGVGIGGASHNTEIKSNRLTDAASSDPNSETVGIYPTSGATLSRNLVSDYDVGVQATGQGKLRLDNDVIRGSSEGSSIGVLAYDSSSDDPNIADVNATNLTIRQTPGGSFSLENNKLDLGSSIVDDKILDSGGASCEIAHSDGPVKNPAAADGCKAFTTTADPKFENNAGLGYHLKSSSPLIDKGSKSKPPSGTKDIDGDKRALAGDCHAKHPKARRDIGADEYAC